MAEALALPPRRARLVSVFAVALSMGAQGPPAPPEDEKQDLAKFDDLVAQTVERFGIAGAAVAVIDDGVIVLAKGYGVADVETGAPVTTDTRFDIASISKLVAAWGVMRLVDQGLVDLDAPVWKYVKTWELPESSFDADGVTVRRLLSHTAGLSLHGYPGYALGEPLPTLVESLSGATPGGERVELIDEPGSILRYSGGGYTLLQLMCEELTGKPFPTYMRETLFTPLGMERTGHNRDPKFERGTARPHGYARDPLPAQAFRAEAACSVHTTLDDLVQLSLAYFDMGPEAPAGRGILSPETVALMGSVVPDSRGRWAHGPRILSEAGAGGDVVFGHAGDHGGWHALIALHPASRDALIVMTNGSGGEGLRQVLPRPWSELAGIDPLLPAYRPPAQLAILGVLVREGASAAVDEYLRLIEEEADAYDFGPRWFGWLADDFLAVGRAGDALELLTLGVDLFEDIPEMWVLVARTHQALGEVDAAREACERALELRPGHAPATELRAELR